MLTSMDKATYTKGTWKATNNRVVKDVANSALQESKGRRGRKQVCVLLEEMLIQPHAELLTNEIEKYSPNGWKRMIRILFLLIFLLR